MASVRVFSIRPRSQATNLEIQGYSPYGTAVGVLLSKAVIQGSQAPPLLLRPQALLIRLQLQGRPQALVVSVVVGIQRQQLPADAAPSVIAILVDNVREAWRMHR